MGEQPIAPTGDPARVAAQPRLLIVDDELVVAWGLGEMARELGWRVCATVTTEAAAVESALHLKPDAILMDYRLAEGGDGLGAARRIRESAETPIIFCTAYAHWLSTEILSVSRTHLIAKPVRLSSLGEALAWAIGVGKPAQTGG